MENTRLENFIWFGKRLLNLAHVAHFTVEDTRVTVRMSDPTNKIDPLDGDEAGPIISVLNDVVDGRMYKVDIPPIPKLDMSVSDNAISSDDVEIETDFKP